MMLLWTFCLLGAAEAAYTRADLDLLRAAERALESSAADLSHHRGYLAYLDSHPEIAEAEDAYTELMKLSSFRRAVEPFQEALLRDAEAREAFDKYCLALAEREDVRRAVEDVHRCELAERRPPAGFPAAMAYLRAHPDEAIRFLDNPSRPVPTPAPLATTLGFFETRPALRAELLDPFLELSRDARARTHVYPWWAMIEARGNATAQAYDRLMRYLVARPSRFWLWHGRNIALASDAHARHWIDHWHQRVRRNPDLARRYWPYLRQAREQGPVQREAAVRWNEAFGEAGPWPPESNPPTLPPLAAPETPALNWPRLEDYVPKNAAGPNGRPKMPAFDFPKFPEMPKLPALPPMPEPKRPKRSPGASDNPTKSDD